VACEETPDLVARVERRRRRIEEARQPVAARPRVAAAFDREELDRAAAGTRREHPRVTTPLLVVSPSPAQASCRRQKSIAAATLRTVCGANAATPTPPS
jgi:hypothetical protein